MFVTSRQLLNDKKSVAKSIYFTPNGVSLSDLSALVELSPDIESIPKPIIGCAALFNNRYDYRMIRNVASSRKDLSFVFVGNVTTRDPTFPQLEQLRNVHFLGHKSRSSLGSYIANFDVCLIPW